MRFEQGQKIVCIKEGTWLIHGTKMPTENPAPRYGDIVTCDGYNTYGMLLLEEYNVIGVYTNTRISFNEIRFAPLMDITELTDILEQEPAEA